MGAALQIGISTCPNDTFAFHALLTGEVEIQGCELEFTLADVEELNAGMFAGRFDVCKVSFHAALAHAENIIVLPSGSALGYGVGPVLLGSPACEHWDPSQKKRVLAPGKWTTASLLMRLFHPEVETLDQVVFSEIMPRLQRDEADYGVCIHEGRFTWKEQGLHLIEDLGERFERQTTSALPLGGLVAQRSLGDEMQTKLARGIQESIAWGLANRAACLGSMRRYAQEDKDEVLWSHIELYVNAWTLDLGTEGRRALTALAKLARERGLLQPGVELRVLPSVS